MRATAAILLALATALSGCTLFGDEANVTAPLHDGPHARLTIQNELPHDARVGFRLLNADGALQSEGELQAPAGEANVTGVPIMLHGQHRLVITYSWTAQGEAASGQLEVEFDSLACGGIVDVEAKIGIGEDGRTYGGTSTSCGRV